MLRFQKLNGSNSNGDNRFFKRVEEDQQKNPNGRNTGTAKIGR
jgi:hypothetical protein